MQLRSFAFSDIGRVRPENEDSFLCDDERQLYAVADGIGGLPAGAQASQKAIAVLTQLIAPHPSRQKLNYVEILKEINQQVFNLGRVLSPQSGLGSTLTCAHLVGVKLHINHVGDSAALRLRSKLLEQLTQDHTVEGENQARLARGEASPLLTGHPQALTRCIGQPPPFRSECLVHTILPHDRYLFATDGITHFVPTAEITDLMQQATSPDEAVTQLIERANQRGGHDNATAVVLFID
jgi:serine/threonine protein phosphatase PrpC